MHVRLSVVQQVVASLGPVGSTYVCIHSFSPKHSKHQHTNVMSVFVASRSGFGGVMLYLLLPGGLVGDPGTGLNSILPLSAGPLVMAFGV